MLTVFKNNDAIDNVQNTICGHSVRSANRNIFEHQFTVFNVFGWLKMTIYIFKLYYLLNEILLAEISLVGIDFKNKNEISQEYFIVNSISWYFSAKIIET